MSPGTAIADAIASAPTELLLVIGSAGALYGLLKLYWFIRRSVIPMAVPGVAFRSIGARIVARAVLKHHTR